MERGAGPDDLPQGPLQEVPSELSRGRLGTGGIQGLQQVRPSLDFTIGLLDPVKTSLDQFFGSDLTVAYFLDGLGGGKFVH